MSQTAATIFAALTIVAILFQVALAAGLPWGALAMGGKYPGKFPPTLRFLTLIQIALLAGMATVVLARAGVAFSELRPLAGTLIWVVVPVSALSMAMNLATPSKWERIVWGPVTVTLFICALIVALN